MKPKHRRMVLLGVAAVGLAVAAAMVVTALEDNLMFFRSPSEVLAGEVPLDQRFRLGGLVADGSVETDAEGVSVRFAVTDTVSDVPVTYVGILPDLFREGQGVVAHGRMGSDGVFVADEVLAKHDETYTPIEAHEAVERARAAAGADGSGS